MKSVEDEDRNRSKKNQESLINRPRSIDLNLKNQKRNSFFIPFMLYYSVNYVFSLFS
jgi:hypothetical protein